MPVIIGPGFFEGGALLNVDLTGGSYQVSTTTDGQTIMDLWGPSGQLFEATTGAGLRTAVANAYDDNFPVQGGISVTIESSGATSASLSARGASILDYLYCHTGGAVKMRTSRNQGRTYSAATTLFASGYSKISTVQDEESGLLVAMLWRDADTTWYVTVGTLDAAGTAWSFSAPSPVASSAASGKGQLRRVQYGGAKRWLFAYITAGGVTRLLECKALASDGSGAWNPLVATVAVGYEIVTFWLDDRDGMLVMWLFDDSAKKWYVTVGELNDAGGTWNFSSPAFLFDGSNSEGDLTRDPAGLWRAIYFLPTGGAAIKRARVLSKGGTGSWA